MFDDQKSTTQGNVPANLPTGEPEDIFADTDPTTPDQEPAAVPEFPSALGAGVLRPKAENTAGSTPQPPRSPSVPGAGEPNAAERPAAPPETRAPAGTMNTQAPPHYDQPVYQPLRQPPSGPGTPSLQEQLSNTGLPSDMIKEPIGKRKVVLWVVLFIVLVALSAGAFWVYFAIIKAPAATTPGFTTTITPPESFAPTPTVPATPTEGQTPPPTIPTPTDGTTVPTDEQILFGEEPVDTDSDGLTDIEEAEVFTDPLDWDSDNDELSDGDEVLVWGTDPLNNDTDADGYPDGLEVKNGYSPKGPGKIFEPPTSTATSSL